MKWYQDFDAAEILCLFVLGIIAITALVQEGGSSIANTVVSGLVGYMVKSVKNGVATPKPFENDEEK
ncbi:hypothetical protein LCGC14_1366490 [marine sediment metagenome]|uniref:Uncharacterized protein n=1 Tax=marine sediment metagenome TaxID=412755 RepID=A0A0F9MLV5_9ZZZZ